jgi:hypothetical protein
MVIYLCPMKDAEVIFAFLVSLGADELTMSQLMALATPFGISETSVRSCLSRLHARDVVAVRKEGRTAWYRLGDGTGPTGRRLSRYPIPANGTGSAKNSSPTAFGHSIPVSGSGPCIRRRACPKFSPRRSVPADSTCSGAASSRKSPARRSPFSTISRRRRPPSPPP